MRNQIENGARLRALPDWPIHLSLGRKILRSLHSYDVSMSESYEVETHLAVHVGRFLTHSTLKTRSDHFLNLTSVLLWSDK